MNTCTNSPAAPVLQFIVSCDYIFSKYRVDVSCYFFNNHYYIVSFTLFTISSIFLTMTDVYGKPFSAHVIKSIPIVILFVNDSMRLCLRVCVVEKVASNLA